MNHNQGRTLLVQTSMGEVPIYNFEPSKLTTILPTTEASCTLVYDGMKLAIDAPLQSVREELEAKPQQSIHEKIVQSLAFKRLVGAQDYIVDIELNRYWKEKHWTFIHWECSSRFTPKGVVISIDARIELTQMDINDDVGSYIMNKTLTFKEDVRLMSVKAARNFNPLEYIEDRCAEGAFGESDVTVVANGQRCLKYHTPHSEIRFFYENLRFIRATTPHRAAIQKYFESNFELNFEKTRQRNRETIQRMENQARIHAAQIMAAGMKQAGKIIKWGR